MESKNTLLPLFVILVLLLVVVNIFVIYKYVLGKESGVSDEAYNLSINPAEFSAVINNKYLTYTPGTKFTYQGQTEEGTERIEVVVTPQTRNVMGINTLVVWDRVWLNNELIEETYDWYAQDIYGNVWYFGEDTKELIGGKVVNTKGSWEASVNGARPGIVMKADPKVGDSYRQEYYKGEAEDMADVVALGLQLDLPYGRLTDCLQTKDWTPLEPDASEYKYYCPGIGNVAYEVGLEDGESVQLISVEKAVEAAQPTVPAEPLKTEITREEAITIALETVDGEFSNIEIERKYGKLAYVVELDVNGRETDVIIDIETGEVLGVET